MHKNADKTQDQWKTIYEELLLQNKRLKVMLINTGTCIYRVNKPGAPLGACPLGFPGCGCADDLVDDPDFVGPADESPPAEESPLDSFDLEY